MDEGGLASNRLSMKHLFANCDAGRIGRWMREDWLPIGFERSIFSLTVMKGRLGDRRALIGFH
jgi:hypothetical protein